MRGLKVRIKKDKNKGWIIYDKKAETVKVQFPDLGVKKEIEKFLGKPMDIYIPMSNKIDDYRIIRGLTAAESLEAFEYFLDNLYKIGVDVIYEESNCYSVEKFPSHEVIEFIYRRIVKSCLVFYSFFLI